MRKVPSDNDPRPEVRRRRLGWILFATCDGKLFERGHFHPNNLRSHYTFNTSCFGMVSFSYVTAKKSVKFRTLLIPNEPTRQKFVQRGLKRAEI